MINLSQLLNCVLFVLHVLVDILLGWIRPNLNSKTPRGTSKESPMQSGHLRDCLSHRTSEFIETFRYMLVHGEANFFLYTIESIPVHRPKLPRDLDFQVAVAVSIL